MASTLKKQDPVCKMDVDPSKSQFKKEYNGKHYSFCSKQCLNEFEKNPQKFS